MSDEKINIIGRFKEIKIKAFKGSKIKFVEFPKISGSQTDAILNIDMGIFENINTEKKNNLRKSKTISLFILLTTKNIKK